MTGLSLEVVINLVYQQRTLEAEEAIPSPSVSKMVLNLAL